VSNVLDYVAFFLVGRKGPWQQWALNRVVSWLARPKPVDGPW